MEVEHGDATDDTHVDASLDINLENISASVNRFVKNEKCPICLQKVDNVTLLDPCYHSFCFLCILQWYQFNPSCPLCKREADSFIYEIRSDTEFKILPTKARERKKMVDRWGCPAFESNFEYNSLFPFTPAHERRKRVYQRQIIPISVNIPNSRLSTGVNPQKKLICTENDWDRKLHPWIKRELQTLMEEEDVGSLLLMFHQIFINNKGDIQSENFIKEIEEFLQDYTPIFMRELQCFVSSNLGLQAYDKIVRYCDITNKN